MITSAGWRALGTGVTVLVTDTSAIVDARDVLEEELDAIDSACSRFRSDSELSRANAAAGKPVPASELFLEAVKVAVRVSDATAGAVHPALGRAVSNLGYDRDFAAVPADAPAPGRPPKVTEGVGVAVDLDSRTVRVSPGVALDLGATAKALAADRSAQRISERLGCGVLVNLGGDIAVAGQAPRDGWRVRICDDHSDPSGGIGQNVAIVGGGLATSSIAVRRWSAGGRPVHHIIDPRTGMNPRPRWRTVSVAAGSCVDANAAATASIVRGDAAPRWLTELGMPSRLVGTDGEMLELCGWPHEETR